MAKYVDKSPVTLWHFFFGALLSMSTAAFIIISHHDSTVNHRGFAIVDIPSVTQHPSLNAAIGHSVLMPNALKNDLTRMITLNGRGFPTEWRFDHWKDIWMKQSRFSDEIIVPALISRMKKNPSSESLSPMTDGGFSKQRIDEIIAKVENWDVMDNRYHAMQELFKAVGAYFEHTERHILPQLLEHFSRKELWALDSIAYRAELDYFFPTAVEDLQSWWLRNLGINEEVQLLLYFFNSWRQPVMEGEEWSSFAKEVLSLESISSTA